MLIEKSHSVWERKSIHAASNHPPLPRPGEKFIAKIKKYMSRSRKSYKVGDSVLLSTKHVNLNLSCKKLCPAFVGPFSIRSLLGANAVKLNYSERFQLLNPTVNIVYLRPYRLRTPDVGHPPRSLSAMPVEVELDGSSWYQVEDILDHWGSPGPKCECLVRWKDFDVSHDSWIKRRFLTPLALAAYERFLTEHVRFCEGRDQQFVTVPKMYAEQLKSACERLATFTGNGRYSVLKTSSSSRAPTTLISSETTFPIAAASMTSDVVPNAPTAGEAVAPILHLPGGSFIDPLTKKIQDVST